MTDYEKGKRDGLDFNVMSDIIVWVRAPDNDDMRRYLMGVIDGLRIEVAKLRVRSVQPRERQ